MKAPTADCVFSIPRALVSQNKRRFQQDGFDLDLCYLHPRIIVMGFPAIGVETMYRNPRREVRRLLEARHRGQYHVYNFCNERDRRYPASVFGGRVKNYPIEDHNVGALDQIFAFCEDAAAWLSQHPDRIVALHCKAGKGRAGMMACMLLVRMGFAASAADAIQHYNRTRVKDLRGLTVVSQRKWVHYYEKLLQETPPTGLSCPIPQRSYLLHALTIKNTLTGVDPPVLRLRVFVLAPDETDQTFTKSLLHQNFGQQEFVVNETIGGSVLVEFRSFHCAKCRLTKHFKIWFNTRFLQPDSNGRVVFAREEMDWVARDKKKRKFPAAFDLEMHVL